MTQMSKKRLDYSISTHTIATKIGGEGVNLDKQAFNAS